MRKYARKDRNHLECLAAFRKLGAAVLDLSHEGNGVPDALVMVQGNRGTVYTLVEIKDGSKPKSERQLTPDQVKFHQAWPDSIPIVESLEDVHRLWLSLINGVSVEDVL